MDTVERCGSAVVCNRLSLGDVHDKSLEGVLADWGDGEFLLKKQDNKLTLRRVIIVPPEPIEIIVPKPETKPKGVHDVAKPKTGKTKKSPNRGGFRG